MPKASSSATSTAATVDAESTTTRDVEVDRETEFVFKMDWEHGDDHKGRYLVGRGDREQKIASQD